MSFIKIANAGPRIKETNYWDSEPAQAGKFMLSINAGCIRLLLPDNQLGMLAEMKTGKKVIISRGPWPDQGKDDGFEIMFEDYSDSPFAIHLGIESWDMLPARNTTGKKWDFAIWTRYGCMYQKKCYYRTVDRIPCMKPWGGTMKQVTADNFPDLLRRIRRAKGWSAREFAEHLGISPRTVEGWEQGRFPKNIIPLINFLLTKKK